MQGEMKYQEGQAVISSYVSLAKVSEELAQNGLVWIEEKKLLNNSWARYPIRSLNVRCMW